MNRATALDYLGIAPQTRSALEALCQEYVWRIDFGHAETIPELFTEDGHWSGPWGDISGRTTLVKAWTRRATETVRTRHMLTNLRFVPITPNKAQGWVGQIVFIADGAEPMRTIPSLIAENRDTYSLAEDGIWRISSRRVVILAQ